MDSTNRQIANGMDYKEWKSQKPKTKKKNKATLNIVVPEPLPGAENLMRVANNIRKFNRLAGRG